MTSPVTAAANTTAAGGAPAGSSNPRVNIEDPAAVNAVPMPPRTSGHISSQYPINAVPSHAASWASKIAAACPASTRSRFR
jgi:hypothetical protein